MACHGVTNSVVRFGFNKSYVKKTGIDTSRPEFNAIYTFSASGLQDDIPEWYKKARRLGGYDAPTKNDPMVYIGKHWSDGTKKNFNAEQKKHTQVGSSMFRPSANTYSRFFVRQQYHQKNNLLRSRVIWNWLLLAPLRLKRMSKRNSPPKRNVVRSKETLTINSSNSIHYVWLGHKHCFVQRRKRSLADVRFVVLQSYIIK